MKHSNFIIIQLNHIHKGLTLRLDAHRKNTLVKAEDASEFNEAEIQLYEGFTYDYEFNNKAFYFEKSALVKPLIRTRSAGSISPNIYTGTLSLPVYINDIDTGKTADLEVRSVKTGYRDDYRDMLEFITEKCTDLLMRSESPVSHNFETDFGGDSNTLYQKFAFVKSVLSTDEFSESVHRVTTSPVTKWKEQNKQRDIRRIRRFTGKNLREVISGTNRTGLPCEHPLRAYRLSAVPSKINAAGKTDSVDTPENRFVKYALEVFLKFCTDINKAVPKEGRLSKESKRLAADLESYLQHSLFREIQAPDMLGISSPVLQRKEGYREILRVWLMFDLAAKLIWKGGEDVYKGGKKDIAALYEYWLFFRLLDILSVVSGIRPKDISKLIKKTDEGLNLSLKQGKHTALNGVYGSGSRKLNVCFSYNRTFKRNRSYSSAGSWTSDLRPDYTLSVWPCGMKEKEAEEKERITHIHFDAKYKVADISGFVQSKGVSEPAPEYGGRDIYKTDDLIKMHAYKDAVRRTEAAVVLYPGKISVYNREFDDILPGIGAFPLKPSKTGNSTGELGKFIKDIFSHLEKKNFPECEEQSGTT